MSGRWTFTGGALQASREPPLPQTVQLEPLREMLAEIAVSERSVEDFVNRWWPDMLARPNDPDAEYVGNGIAFRVSGDEVIFHPLYDQWEGAAFVYIPLADVQDLIDQYAAYVRHREREERSS